MESGTPVRILSDGDRTREHPLHVVAKRAGVALPEIELLTGVRASLEERATSADRFALAATSHVRGRHILLAEDTWTSGGNAQSAPLTLRGGGAASVTIVVLARWLKSEEPRTDAFVRSRLTEDYCTTRLSVRLTTGHALL